KALDDAIGALVSSGAIRTREETRRGRRGRTPTTTYEGHPGVLSAPENPGNTGNGPPGGEDQPVSGNSGIPGRPPGVAGGAAERRIGRSSSCDVHRRTGCSPGLVRDQAVLAPGGRRPTGRPDRGAQRRPGRPSAAAGAEVGQCLAGDFVPG